MPELTGLTGLSGMSERLPERAIMTDDPMRAKMLAAHWLDNAREIYELRGMIGYIGTYKNMALCIISSGYGESSTLTYLNDAFIIGVRRMLYIGECISVVTDIKPRDIIIASGGDAALTQDALSISKQLSIPASVRDVETNDRLFIERKPISGDIVDFATSSIYQFSSEHGIAALTILTVTRNTATGDHMEDHERQSRFHSATQLSFETIICR